MSPTNYFNDDAQPWTLQQIYDDLGSRQDIGRVLNVGDFRVMGWVRQRERYKCPEPVKRIGHIDVYSMQEWKDWFARWTDKHKEGKFAKRFAEAAVHGSGESFWSYFEQHGDDDD